MPRHDCMVLYNTANIVETEGSMEKTYPSTVIREEVGAVEDSLRECGFNPYPLSVDHFSREMVQTLFKLSPRFVFNLCEEINGRTELEMCVAGLLELLGVPYTGSGPLALGIALNKFQVKRILRASGIPSPRGYLVFPGERPNVRLAPFPVIVKPAHEDASLGINSSSICHDLAQLEVQVAYIHEIYSQEALVEEYLDGREFNVSILGDDQPAVLAVSEIDFSGMPEGEPHIVSYRAKWDDESPLYLGTKPVCPAPIGRRLENRIKEIALGAYRAIGCRDYGRVDMRTDSRGNLYVLEVNPNPDIAPSAGFARAGRCAGYSYAELIHRICQLAMARGAKLASTVYAM